jgi:hypothetical protein
MNGQSILTDETQIYYSTAPVTVGTPPQQVDMTINTYSTLVAAFSNECNLCAGSTFFDRSLSSTFGVRIHLCNFFRPVTHGYFSSHQIGHGTALAANYPGLILKIPSASEAASLWTRQISVDSLAFIHLCY